MQLQNHFRFTEVNQCTVKSSVYRYRKKGDRGTKKEEAEGAKDITLSEKEESYIKKIKKLKTSFV